MITMFSKNFLRAIAIFAILFANCSVSLASKPGRGPGGPAPYEPPTTPQPDPPRNEPPPYNPPPAYEPPPRYEPPTYNPPPAYEPPPRYEPPTYYPPTYPDYPSYPDYPTYPNDPPSYDPPTYNPPPAPTLYKADVEFETVSENPGGEWLRVEFLRARSIYDIRITILGSKILFHEGYVVMKNGRRVPINKLMDGKLLRPGKTHSSGRLSIDFEDVEAIELRAQSVDGYADLVVTATSTDRKPKIEGSRF